MLPRLVVLVGLALSGHFEARWKMASQCQALIVQRADPLLTPNGTFVFAGQFKCVHAVHPGIVNNAHIFYGGGNLDLAISSNETLPASTCSSCQGALNPFILFRNTQVSSWSTASSDFTLYWHPALYVQLANGSLAHAGEPLSCTAMFYLNDTVEGNVTPPCPVGLSTITGDQSFARKDRSPRT